MMDEWGRGRGGEEERERRGGERKCAEKYRLNGYWRAVIIISRSNKVDDADRSFSDKIVLTLTNHLWLLQILSVSYYYISSSLRSILGIPSLIT